MFTSQRSSYTISGLMHQRRDHVKVRIEGQHVGVALYCGDRAEVVGISGGVVCVEIVNVIEVGWCGRIRQAAALIVSAERIDEDVERVCERLGEIGEVGVERVGEGQDPLAIAERGDHLLALALSSLRHVARCAARADAATLAGEGDESVVFTLGAVEAREASFELTAAQVALEGIVHEARERSPLFGESIVETREVLGDDTVKRCELRTSTLILTRGRW